MKLILYKVVDVFSFRPLLGNPVAVVMDAEGLTPDADEAVARWIQPFRKYVGPSAWPQRPRDAARLRIFTPRREASFRRTSDTR